MLSQGGWHSLFWIDSRGSSGRLPTTVLISTHCAEVHSPPSRKPKPDDQHSGCSYGLIPFVPYGVCAPSFFPFASGAIHLNYNPWRFSGAPRPLGVPHVPALLAVVPCGDGLDGSGPVRGAGGSILFWGTLFLAKKSGKHLQVAGDLHCAISCEVRRAWTQRTSALQSHLHPSVWSSTSTRCAKPP